MTNFKLSKNGFLLLGILLLGFFLRIYKISDYIIFLGDEGRDALVVYNIIHGHLTLLGPTSSVGGFFLGPIYYYLMAPFLFLSRYDPVGPAVMVVLFGLATIYLVYRLGKEFFNEKAGLIAAFLYAISPIVIIYSRSSWNPNVFPFFTIATLYALYKGIAKNKLWIIFTSGILMGINLQIHYLATFVGGVMFFYVLFADLKLSFSGFTQTLRRYLVLFAGFLVGFSPFLAFEARHQFANSQNILRFIFNSPDTGAGGQLFTNISNVFLRLFGGVVASFPLPQNFKNFSGLELQIWLVFSVALGFSAVLFFIDLFWRKRGNKSKFYQYLLLFLWVLVGVCLFGFYKKSVYDYYLGFLFPLPFLLIGFFLSFLSERFKTLGKLSAISIIGLLVIINLNFSPIRAPGNQQAKQAKTISDFVLSKTGNKPFNFALITGGNSDHAYRYFFKLERHDPVTIQFPGIDPGRNTVTNQLFVVCESLPCSPQGESLWEIAGFGRADVAGHWKVSVVEVYKLVHYHDK